MPWNKRAREPRQGRVNPSDLPRGPAGRALCRFCESEVGGRRRSFCSDVCVDQHRLRSSIDYKREAVFKRDQGVCAMCLEDCVRLKIEARATAERDGGETAIALLQGKGFNAFRARRTVEIGAELWDADHILAVSEGGGDCGLDGMRTLCARCHARETRDLRKRLALGISADHPRLWND